MNSDDAWDEWAPSALGNARYLSHDSYRQCFDGGWSARGAEVVQLNTRLETSERRMDYAFHFASMRQADLNFVESKLDEIGKIVMKPGMTDTERVTAIWEVIVGWITSDVTEPLGEDKEQHE